MKRNYVLTAVAFLGIQALGVVTENKEQLEARYGEPVHSEQDSRKLGGGLWLHYEYGDYRISAYLRDGECRTIKYYRTDGSAIDSDVKELLKLNGSDKIWKPYKNVAESGWLTLDEELGAEVGQDAYGSSLTVFSMGYLMK